ncbi:sugar ABC transporter substrate-binding protein [Rubrobacter taiwanensis]|jgi:multiple sugar transport system substrate-binding protein|uniref:Sugar ABC transporter substrate-binding protein n=1 Tax=Rubrobacter taiwanensis TaxID=185139 RepID=A0A4R1BKW3_9ACTN|nr:sugar ABC transporter substrate-binding protein [Rubrobacter taiwanensis]TCJ18065.1 sugar ABC transporter substrate-binding protein [Rubrobacter taiwanensis]
MARGVRGRGLTRREFLITGLGAGAGLVLLGGCGGDTSEAEGEIQLNFATWGIDAELEAFQNIINQYEAENPDVSINLTHVPSDYYEQLDTRLAAGNAPDIVRMQYQQIGRYSSEGALVDLTPYLSEGDGDEFEPAFWQAVGYEDRVYGLPHHTDTFALFYNADYFEQLGVEVPQSLEECWSWEEFTNLARQIKEETNATFGFAMNWQESNPYRWMPFLYQRGGQFLNDDLSAPQINTPEGIDTIAWTQSWFEEDLVPPNTSVKSTEEIHALFANGTIGMMLNGDWYLPYLEDHMTNFEYGVTYMPCNIEKASDMGGNALAVSKDSNHPEVAADFIKFVVNEDNMRNFVTSATFIPVRTSLLEQELDYRIRPDAMEIFLEQARTIPEHMASVQTLPEFNQINQVMADELELAFVAGQDPRTTAQKIEEGTANALGN